MARLELKSTKLHVKPLLTLILLAHVEVMVYVYYVLYNVQLLALEFKLDSKINDMRYIQNK